VDGDDIAGMVKSVTLTPSVTIEEMDGYFIFDVAAKPRWYRVAVFRGPPEGRMLVMSMPAAQDTIERGRQSRPAAKAKEPPPAPTPKVPLPSRPAGDRTLETMVRRGRFLLLASDAPPLLRDAYGLRSLYVASLDTARLKTMLDEALPNAGEVAQHDGYA